MEKEKFKCDLCNVIYSTNVKLINHKKKIHNIDNDLKYLNCKKCGKSFLRRQNLYAHNKICKKTISNEIKNNNLTESNINNEQTIVLIEQIKILSQKVNELTESNKKNKSININSNNNNNNTNNTINNNIIINGIGKEDMSFLSLEDKQNILKAGLNSIFKLVEKINFNDNQPTNHNFCVTSINDKHASIINPDNNKIIKADKTSLFDTVAINNFRKLESIANNPDFTDSENDLYNNEISKLKDMLFIDNNGLKIFHSEINLLSYNNKDIILDTWKNIKAKEN